MCKRELVNKGGPRFEIQILLNLKRRERLDHGNSLLFLLHICLLLKIIILHFDLHSASTPIFVVWRNNIQPQILRYTNPS